MKKGISLLLLAMILSSCGVHSPQDEEIPFEEETHEEIPSEEDKEEDEEQGEEQEQEEEKEQDEEEEKQEEEKEEDPPIPEVIKVNAFTLEESSVVLGLSSTYKLKYSVLPVDAENKKITWSSDDTKICSINSSGTITGKRVGETTVRGSTTDGSNLSVECSVKVQPISVTNVTVSDSRFTLFEGEKSTFTCTVLPSNATNKSLEVSSLDEEIATVNKETEFSYSINAIKAGTTQIKVSSIDNSEIVKFIDVTVNSVKLESISINKERVYLNEESTFQLQTNFVPSNASNKNVTFESSDESIATVDSNGLILAMAKGTATITVTSEDGGFTKTCEVIVEEKGKFIKSSLLYKQKDLYNNYAGNVDCCPSLGDVNILVVPVWFTDSLSFIATQKKEAVRKDIEKAFIGTNEQTGWRSVKTYYEELSMGKLNLNPIVSNWYECGMKSMDFYSQESGLSKVESLVNSAASWFKASTGRNSMSEFDADNNGFIDGVVLIYACPDYGAWDKYSTGYTNLWAYTYWHSDNRANVSDPNPNAFMWASYDFMYSPEKAYERTAKSECGGGDTTNCNLDTHTYIHEMGHVLGLNDYYDYSNTYTASAGFSMQDLNIGSHDPYSCMKFGYADPYVATGDTTITINDFQSSRDLIMVTNNFSGSPFDEYFLIELYTPTGLNEFDCNAIYGGEESGRPKGLDKPGIRLWHVDGRLAYATRSGLGYIFGERNVTTNPYIENAQVCELMANSFNVPEREAVASLSDYSELFLVRNDRNVTYMPSNDDWMFNEDCMFYKGDTFNINTYAKQFKNSKKGVEEALLNNGEEFRFNIKVESLSSESATISISTY